MLVKCYEKVYKIPDELISKYTKEFEVLPNKGFGEEINLLRDSVYQILLLVSVDPDMLNEVNYKKDFINALAIKKAMENNGILHDD
jgi:hypothetical protein